MNQNALNQMTEETYIIGDENLIDENGPREETESETMELSEGAIVAVQQAIRLFLAKYYPETEFDNESTETITRALRNNEAIELQSKGDGGPSIRIIPQGKNIVTETRLPVKNILPHQTNNPIIPSDANLEEEEEMMNDEFGDLLRYATDQSAGLPDSIARWNPQRYHLFKDTPQNLEGLFFGDQDSPQIMRALMALSIFCGKYSLPIPHQSTNEAFGMARAWSQGTTFDWEIPGQTDNSIAKISIPPLVGTQSFVTVHVMREGKLQLDQKLTENAHDLIRYALFCASS